jgi:GGDEF domain-containing protein
LDAPEASDLALAIRATLSYPVSLPHKQVKIDVSIGYAPIELSGEVERSLRAADLAMYEAKRSRSGVQLWQGDK